MAKINLKPLKSAHSPEKIWEALQTPVPSELTADIVSSRVALDYRNLGGDGRIQQGTRLIYIPRLGSLLDMAPADMREKVPDEVALTVEGLSDEDKTRADVIEDGQMPKGAINYRVEEGEDNGGLLIVEGELAVEGFGGFWTMMGGDQLAIEHGVHQPAKRLLENIPAILDA